MGVWLQAEIRLARGADAAAIRDWLAADGVGGDAIARMEGQLWGVWAGGPGIGFRSDEVIVHTVWPDDAAAGAATELMINAPPAIDVRGTPLHPTARPTSAAPIGGDGIWVFRDFEIAPEDVDRFLELSTSAWESFEERFDARIDGLFRAPDPDADSARMLLVTRYADLATWQASRSPDADPEAWARFSERRALTRWTQARAAIRVDA